METTEVTTVPSSTVPTSAMGVSCGNVPTVLLVDDEINILSALKRLLRQHPYQIVTACSGAEGLARLEEQRIDVVVSDQRMPGMTGVEFLRIVKQRYPETVRIVLSGYTELQSVTDAINEGAIYKFLTKPWDDLHLVSQLAEAVERKRLSDENRRLTTEIQEANAKLALLNLELQETAVQTQRRLQLNEAILQVTRDVLQQVPVPILCLDAEGVVVFCNREAATALAEHGPLLGNDLQSSLPEIAALLKSTTTDGEWTIDWNGRRARVRSHRMERALELRGAIISIALQGDCDSRPAS